MQLDITANASNALSGLQSVAGGVNILNKQFERLQRIASLPNLSFRQQERLNAMIARTQAELTKFDRAANIANPAMAGFTKSSNEATGSLINLGRVVQDAPYGFIGIANNLNPLAEGFGRLTKSSGGFRGAIKALGSSLLGAGGLSVAISLVSTGLILFGDKLFGASKKAKEADKANRELAEGFSQSVVKLTALVGIVQNVNTSYDNKRKALQALNEQYGSYLGNLENEKITAENVGKAYEKIVDAMLRQAVVKGLQDEIAKSVEEVAKKVIAIEKAREKERITTQGVVNTTKVEKDVTNVLADALGKVNRVTKDGIIAQANYGREQAAIIAQSNTYENRLKAVKDELFAQLDPLLKLTTSFEDLDFTLKKTGEDGEKTMRKLAQQIQDLLITPPTITFSEFDTDKQALEKSRQTIQGFFDGTIYKLKIQPVVSFGEPGDEASGKLASAASRDIQQLVQDINKTFEKEIASGVSFRAGAILGEEFVDGVESTTGPGTFDKNLELASQLTARFRQQFDELGLSFAHVADIDFSKGFVENADAITKQLERIRSGFNGAQIAADFFSSSISGAFDALLSGRNAIEVIRQGLQQLIIDLIRVTLQAIILSTIKNLLVPGSGAAANAGARGAGAIPRGGPIAGLATSLVPGGGRAAISAGNMQLSVSGQLIGRGNDLVAVVSAAGRQNGRIG